MRSDLEKRVQEESMIALQQGKIVFVIDTSQDLDSGRRFTFLNAMRRHGNELRGIKTFDYIVCFQGFIQESYRFLRILLEEASRLDSGMLRVHICNLQLIIQSQEATIQAKKRRPSSQYLN